MHNSKALDSRTIANRRHRSDLYLTLEPLSLSAESPALPKPQILSEPSEKETKRETSSVTIQVDDYPVQSERHIRRHSWLLKPSPARWFNTFPADSKPLIRVSLGPCFASIKTMKSSSSQPNFASSSITSTTAINNDRTSRRSQVSMNINLTRQTSAPTRPASASPSAGRGAVYGGGQLVVGEENHLRPTHITERRLSDNPPAAPYNANENMQRIKDFDRPSQSYLQALHRHQRERMIMLLAESKKLDSFLNVVRAEVADLEKKASQSMRLWPEKKNLRDEIHQLMIDCACLSMEIDMQKVDIPLGTTDERVYRHLSPGARAPSIEIETVADYVPARPRREVRSTTPSPVADLPHRTSPVTLPNNNQPPVLYERNQALDAYLNAVQSSDALEQNQSTTRERTNSDEVYGSWQCVECTFMNHPDLNRCEICELPRSGCMRPCEGNTKEDSGFDSYHNRKPLFKESSCYCHDCS